MTLLEEMMYNTARITTIFNKKNKNDFDIQHGTGFFVKFKNGVKEKACLITNKHILYMNGNSADSISFLACADNNGKPNDKKHLVFEAKELKNKIFDHSNESIDLCAIEISNFITRDEDKAFNIYYLANNIKNNKNEIEKLDYIEDVIMVGYPNGLWDMKNNKPLARKGITSSHFKYDFDGKSQFLVDIASFQGSSGSPIFIVKQEQNTYKLILLGIFQGLFKYDTNGENTHGFDINIPMNLGIVIKSENILDFKEKLLGVKE